MSEAASVWITRPEPGNSRTSEFLSAAGVPVVPVPVLRVEMISPPNFSADPLPDWIVFVSRNAVAGMNRLWEFLGGISRSEVRAAAVGQLTAAEAEARGWKVSVVPETENAGGLLGAMEEHEVAGRTVWIPSGNREGSASSTLPDTLRSRGARVRVIPVYETRTVAPPDPHLHLLERARPGAVVLHSPSSGEAVMAKDAPPAYARWRDAFMVCIGPVTRARIQEMGAPRSLETREPSDEAVLDALRSLEDLGLPKG